MTIALVPKGERRADRDTPINGREEERTELRRRKAGRAGEARPRLLLAAFIARQTAILAAEEERKDEGRGNSISSLLADSHPVPPGPVELIWMDPSRFSPSLPPPSYFRSIGSKPVKMKISL